MKRAILLAAVVVIIHTLMNGQYGFHRDELATFDDARHLAWGYVAYPPLTPFVAHISQVLFGDSLRALRFFAVLAQALAMIVTALMARELGGNDSAQFMAALAVAISPLSVFAGDAFQYVTFDYLWWVLIAYFLIRMLNSQDPRWWLAIGTVVGLGAMTKYTIGVFVVSFGLGLLFTPARKLIASVWLLGGIGIAAVMFAPNAIWQIQHHFISIDFLQSIHARDVRIGRASGFVLNQLFVPASLFSIPLWIAGLYFYARRHRALGLTFIFCFLFLLIAKGRDYYMAPAYPMLFAGGATLMQSRRWMWVLLAIGAACTVFFLPIAPINSWMWNKVQGQNYDFREEVGWQDLAREVAAVRNSLPADERVHTAIFANNYGQAGAIDLYGPALGLPPVLSSANSYWLRGYPDPAPTTLIVIGGDCAGALQNLEFCEVAGKITNRYGVRNEENGDNILICRGLRRPWSEIWPELRRFQ